MKASIISFEEHWKRRNKQKVELTAYTDLETYVALQVATWLKLFETAHGRPRTSIEELVEWVETLGPDDDEPMKVLTKSEVQEALNQNFDRLLEISKILKGEST